MHRTDRLLGDSIYDPGVGRVTFSPRDLRHAPTNRLIWFLTGLHAQPGRAPYEVCPLPAP